MTRERSAVEALGEWVATTQYAELPVPVRRTAANIVADVTGVALRGSREPEVRRLSESKDVRTGEAIVIGKGFPRRDATTSALANAAAITWFELDPGHESARTHAAAHVLPALLAASNGETSGEDVLVATVAGLETAYRVGLAVRSSPQIHSHGMWSVIGAAAAVSRLRRLPPTQTIAALRISAHLMLATTSETVRRGATVRNVLPGVAAVHALMSADLAEAGLQPLDDPLGAVLGDAMGCELSFGRLSSGLGDQFEVTRTYHKVHACCHHLASAVDGALQVRQDLEFDPRDISQVDVATYDLAAQYCRRDPPNELAAMFSLPYVVSAALVYSIVGPDQLGAEGRTDHERRRIERVVEVRADATATASYPVDRMATVTVTLRDGRAASATCRNPVGSPKNKLTDEDLRDKFLSLSSLAIPSSGPALWTALMQSAQQLSFSSVFPTGGEIS